MHDTAPPRFSARDLSRIALGAALLAVCSWLSIPLAVPFTLQTFAVCLLAVLLGPRRGLQCLLVYLLLGAAGLPVFSGFKGGLGVLLGATGGYLAGFAPTVLILGFAAERFPGRTAALALAAALGIALCYVCGTAWFMLVYARGGEAISLWGALKLCVLPFLPPDALKAALALWLARRLSPLLRQGHSRKG